jgi:hypothetical protein
VQVIDRFHVVKLAVETLDEVTLGAQTARSRGSQGSEEAPSPLAEVSGPTQCRRVDSKTELERVRQEIVVEYLKMLAAVQKLSDTYGFEAIYFWQPLFFTKQEVFADEARAAREYAGGMGDDENLAWLYRAVLQDLRDRQVDRFYDISDVLRDRKGPVYTDAWHVNEMGNELVAAQSVARFEQLIRVRRWGNANPC